MSLSPYYINVLAVLFGIIGGILYYYNMKLSIKKPYKNCSFVANKLTDILAFIIGGIICYYGFIYNNRVLIFCGICIISEHILQFTYK